MRDLTVILPTFNEDENIGNITTEILRIFQVEKIDGELLVVDDDSQDKTIEIMQSFETRYDNVRLIIRKSDHGLSQSVVEGLGHADADIILVMDADFSHPLDLIKVLFHHIREGNDLVIGSRYLKGGSIKKWPLKRKILSFGATILGRFLYPPVTDPVSGFFAIKKQVVDTAILKPRGYKILLEIIGKGNWDKFSEIPYEFSDRDKGKSKLTFKIIVLYVLQFTDIVQFTFSTKNNACWRYWKNLFSI